MQEIKVVIILFKKWNPSYKIFSERNIQAQRMLHVFKEEISPIANYQAITEKDPQAILTHEHKSKTLKHNISEENPQYVKKNDISRVTGVAYGRVNFFLLVYSFLA